MVIPTEDSGHYQFKVEKKDEGSLKNFFKRFGFSSRQISSVKRKGRLLLNGKPAFFIDKAKEGDTVDLYFPEEEVDTQPSPGELDIIYEDDEVLVLNKPTLVVTHPTKDYQDNTLANYIAYYYKETDQHHKIRFVNRLDRDTTGIIVVAKNPLVHHYIQSRMSTEEVKKTYLAITENKMPEQSGAIDLPIYRPDPESIERVVDENGLPSLTYYKVLKEFSDASLVECVLGTGRTHQLRVHLKAVGAPIIGDPLYNPESGERYNFDRQALHARRLELTLPKTGKHVFEAEIPEDMKNLESRLRKA